MFQVSDLSGLLAFEDPAVIQKEQLKNIQDMLLYVWFRSQFYRRRFQQNKINIEKINSLEAFSEIPFTTKEDLQRNNEDFICARKEDIVEFVSTSGTTGDPIYVGLTKNDLLRLAKNEEISFRTAGFNKNDVVQLLVTLDNMFIAGLAYYLGLKTLGAVTVRMGVGNPYRQLSIMRSLNITGLVSVPSYLLKLYRYAVEENFDFKKYGPAKIVCIGEAIKDKSLKLNALGQLVQEKWNCDLFSSYSSTEIATTFCECQYQQGGHLIPELAFLEIVDEKGDPITEDYVPGELVLTTFKMEGMPLLRYKTGDIVFKVSTPCSCGRNSVRIGPVLGRKNHMIKLKGTTIYPGHIENAIIGVDGVENYIIELSSDETNNDRVYVKIGSYRQDTEHFIEMLKERIKSFARVTVEVGIYDPEEINKIQFEDNRRKARKIIDNRQTDGEIKKLIQVNL